MTRAALMGCVGMDFGVLVIIGFLGYPQAEVRVGVGTRLRIRSFSGNYFSGGSWWRRFLRSEN